MYVSWHRRRRMRLWSRLIGGPHVTLTPWVLPPVQSDFPHLRGWTSAEPVRANAGIKTVTQLADRFIHSRTLWQGKTIKPLSGGAWVTGAWNIPGCPRRKAAARSVVRRCGVDWMTVNDGWRSWQHHGSIGNQLHVDKRAVSGSRRTKLGFHEVLSLGRRAKWEKIGIINGIYIRLFHIRFWNVQNDPSVNVRTLNYEQSGFCRKKTVQLL